MSDVADPHGQNPKGMLCPPDGLCPSFAQLASEPGAAAATEGRCINRSDDIVSAWLFSGREDDLVASHGMPKFPLSFPNAGDLFSDVAVCHGKL